MLVVPLWAALMAILMSVVAQYVLNSGNVILGLSVTAINAMLLISNLYKITMRGDDQ